MLSLTRRFIGLFILSVSTLLSAQEERGVDAARSSPVITAATAGEKLRFSSPVGVAQIQVQIISAAGDPRFDSTWKDGNVFDWEIENLGQPLANGSYRCVVMVKDLDGRVTRKEAVLTVEGGRVSIEPGAGNDGLTAVGTGESGPKITVLAHDEKNGAIVNTGGDLSFRFGEFFAGKDSERMRLTAGGRLGIGTDKPQAPLDVIGLIRTSEGIMFPDGTILTTAGGDAVTGKSGAGSRVTGSVVGGVAPGSESSANSRRLTPRPNALAYQFVVDAAGVHIGTTSAYGLDVAGNVTLSSNLALPATTGTGSAGVITLGASRFAHNWGNDNTFLGVNAGNFTMGGFGNTASGVSALASNGAGSNNTANGYVALTSNTGGNENVASGWGVLSSNTTGFRNTGIGFRALVSNTTGAGNIAVGQDSGINLTTGNNNIDIGNAGVLGEADTIRIGAAGSQSRAFLAGVRGVTTGIADGLTVLIDSAGQLGTVSSSASIKRDITGVGEESSALMKLRPVSFFYRSDAASIRQYGLIAEEVAEVMPELVQLSAAGEAETVRYHFLAPLLLDQVQKQHRQIERQDRRIEEQARTIDALKATLELLGQRLQALERQARRN